MTFTMKVQNPTFPSASTEVTLTTVTPRLKFDPEGGSEEGWEGNPELSSAGTCSQSTTANGLFGSRWWVMLLGHVTFGDSRS